MAHIICKNATVEFPIYDNIRNITTNISKLSIGGALRWGKSSRPIVRGLDSLNIELYDGDRLGLIGENGAGKTTLLRLISGVYEPSIGSVDVEGRLFPLLNASPGLYLDDSGYDNIFNCGLLLGMTLPEVREKAASIAEFSGLGDFLNFPIRTYSAGMQLRLTFAIATAIDPDILILDEIIGAGDASFVDKAQRRIQNLLSRSSIVVLASHSTDILKKWCNRALVLHHGIVLFDGSVNDADQFYHEEIVNKKIAEGVNGLK